jgi:hypothetical protein
MDGFSITLELDLTVILHLGKIVQRLHFVYQPKIQATPVYQSRVRYGLRLDLARDAFYAIGFPIQWLIDELGELSSPVPGGNEK